MSFLLLDDYLGRLANAPTATSSVWRNADGRTYGQFFNCTLTSAFQSIERIDGSGGVVGFEGLARGASNEDVGLSLWRMLDRAASEDESVELDRLCRMLHSINYFRQQDDDAGAVADLYLSVHDRLLSAVSSNHGYAFRRILHALGLPDERIVLQLPAVGAASRWLANYVADNYRRNGFRLAFNTAGIGDAMEVVGQFAPHAVKIDARALRDDGNLADLLALSQDAGVKVIVKRVESPATLALLQQAANEAAAPVHAQGYLVEAPRAALHGRWRDAPISELVRHA